MLALPQELQALFEGRFCLGVCFFAEGIFSVCVRGRGDREGLFQRRRDWTAGKFAFFWGRKGESIGCKAKIRENKGKTADLRVRKNRRSLKKSLFCFGTNSVLAVQRFGRTEFLPAQCFERIALWMYSALTGWLFGGTALYRMTF